MHTPPDRAAEVEALLARVTAWAERRPDVRALALVGSWARGTPRADSDVDLVLLTTDPDPYIGSDKWVGEIGGTELVTTRAWGRVTERRVLLPSGLEVELGVGTPTWATTDPLDPGTRRVVRDGMRILVDLDGLLGELRAAAGRSG